MGLDLKSYEDIFFIFSIAGSMVQMSGQKMWSIDPLSELSGHLWCREQQSCRPWVGEGGEEI
jgi:hypothetical protein